MKDIAVVIPVYGNHELTYALIKDIVTENRLVDIVVIDNKGDYIPINKETVLNPGENLGWLRGNNLGIKHVLNNKYRFVTLLNNDTRLSPDFFSNLILSQKETGAGLLGPMYDDMWLHQRVDNLVNASEYRPQRVFERAPFIDGACMFIMAEVVKKVGLLDETRFGKYGWGADIDYGIRVREEGYGVMVTKLCYLNHLRGTTAKSIDNDYNEKAGEEMNKGLEEKWGKDWVRKGLVLNGKLFQPLKFKYFA